MRAWRLVRFLVCVLVGLGSVAVCGTVLQPMFHSASMKSWVPYLIGAGIGVFLGFVVRLRCPIFAAALNGIFEVGVYDGALFLTCACGGVIAGSRIASTPC
jgi:hypothetical protein